MWNRRTRHAYRKNTSGNAGFTLVELVVILLLIGILSAIAIPRLAGLQGFDERGFHDELISAVRYGQKAAVASGCPVEVSLSGGYALSYNGGDCGTANVLNPVTRQQLAETAPAGVNVSAANFTFTAGGGVAGGGDVTVTVGSRGFTVVGETGYVVRN